MRYFLAREARRRKRMPGELLIYSIGHSNRSIEEFSALLVENTIELLVDVRSIPRSRTTPQFNSDLLPASLARYGIDYLHLPELGGLRHKQKTEQSPNSAWENLSFRNYADYAQTEPFRRGLEQLMALAKHKRTAYTCAEAVWWRCHRRIITDYLLAAGWKVEHIMAAHKLQTATLNVHAIVEPNGIISYPADQQELPL